MNKKKIMIVEDDRIIAEDIKRTLKRLNYEVTSIVPTGEEAIERADTEEPDLVLMDIVLAGKMNGIESAKVLHSRLNIPTVYLTAYADEKILKRARISGPYGYIIKPFEERELHSNIEIALYKSHADRLIQRLNMVLRTIRTVNQFVVRERDQKQLLKGLCRILIKRGGYTRAWIVLVDRVGKMKTYVQCGWGRKIQPLVNMLKRGELPDCCIRAVESRRAILTESRTPCPNCPFDEVFPDYRNLTVALMFHNTTYGFLSVGVPRIIEVDESEMELIKELADDIGFILHDFDIEAEKQQIEEDLKEREKQYRKVVNSVNDVLFNTDFQGHWTLLNPAWTRITGYSVEESLGVSFLHYIYKNDRETFLKQLQPFFDLKVRSLRTQIRFLTKSGDIRWLEVVVNRTEDEKGEITGSAGILTDITDRKQVEEALRESEKKFKSLSEESPNMIFINKRGRVVYANRKCEEVMGYTKEEFYSKDFNLMDIISLESQDLINENMKRHFKGEEILPFESKLVTKEGKILIAIITTKLIKYEGDTSVLGIVTDITEYKEMEDALRESEERYRTLVNLSPEAITATDLEGRVTAVNRKKIELYGCESEEEIIGMSAFDLIAPKDRERAIKNAQKVLEVGHVENIEYELLRKDGSTYDAELSASLLRDSEGKPIGFISTVRDITKRKRAEKELKMLANAIKSVSEFVCVTDTQDKILFVNDASLRIYGYKKEELIGKSIEIVRSPNNPPELVKAILPETLKGGWHGELLNRRKDGTEFPIYLSTSLILDERNKPIGLMGVAEDISERKKAEAALEESESKFRMLTEKSLVGVYLIQEGVFRYVNPRLADIFGYTPDELIEKKGPMELTLPEDRSIVEENIRRRLTGEVKSVHYQVRALKKNKEVIEVEVFGSRIVYKGKPAILGTLLDITERKRTEEILKIALDESQQRQADVSALLKGSRAILEHLDFEEAARKIFDSCKNLIGATAGYVALLTPNGKENEVLFLDSGGLSCTVDPSLPMPIRGLRAEAYHTCKAVYQNDFSNSKWVDFMPEGHVSLENVLFAPLVIEEKAVGLMGIANKPGGFTQKDTQMANAFGELAAIALRNSRIFESLTESEERYRKVVENASDIIFQHDIEGCFTFINPIATKITEYLEEELVGMHYTSLVHPDDVDRIKDIFEKQFKKRTKESEYECRIVTKKGKVVWINARVTMLMEGDRIIGWQSIGRNITDRKMAEDKIKQQLDELQRWHQLMLDREERVMQLKREVNELLKRLDKPIRYPSQEISKGKNE